MDCKRCGAKWKSWQELIKSFFSPSRLVQTECKGCFSSGMHCILKPLNKIQVCLFRGFMIITHERQERGWNKIRMRMLLASCSSSVARIECWWYFQLIYMSGGGGGPGGGMAAKGESTVRGSISTPASVKPLDTVNKRPLFEMPFQHFYSRKSSGYFLDEEPMFEDSISIFVGMKPLDTINKKPLFETAFQYMQARKPQAQHL